MMMANDFYGKVHIIGNTGIRSLLGKLMEKGQYNVVDKSIEWAGKQFHFSNRLANASNTRVTPRVLDFTEETRRLLLYYFQKFFHACALTIETRDKLVPRSFI